MNKEKTATLLNRLAVFLSAFTLSCIAGSIAFLPHESKAASSSKQVDVNLEVNPVIAITTSSNSIDLEISPNSTGSLDTSDISILVDTNNQTGYTLSMNTITDNTSLTHTNEQDTVPSTNNPLDSELPLQANTWGYNKNIGTESFLRIPTKSLSDTINTSDAPVAGDETIITVGAKVDTTKMSGNYSNTLEFTAVTNYVPPTPPKEQFVFTIDTRMPRVNFGDDSTLDTDPEYLSGTETSFYVPLNYDVAPTFNWLIDWGDGTPSEIFTEAILDTDYVAHDFAAPGEYQITIKPNGIATDGWLNAWGDDDYGDMWAIKTIDSPLTNLMRSSNSSYRFAKMFQSAHNATSIPENLFDFVEVNNSTNLSSMFSYTFQGFGHNSTTITIPSGLFDSINTSNATSLESMFESTFMGFGRNSSHATIPDDLFTSIDTSNAANMSLMFSSTFSSFGPYGTEAGTTNINNIWGNASLASTITQSNIGDIFPCTFFHMTSLVGSAQSFIDTKLGGITPLYGPSTFTLTSISDAETIPSGWTDPSSCNNI